MIKRFVLFVLLAGFLAGCATQQVPVVDPVEEAALKPQTEELQQERIEEVAQSPKEVEEIQLEAAPEEPLVAQESQKQVEPERTIVMILMKTSKGDIKLELDKEKAPKTVANFMKYVEEGHFSGTIFHRVIDNFMIQGGGFDADMNQKPAPSTVENEAENGLKNVIGSIAMARTSDPHSASAQFFININDNTFLDYPGQDGWGYCVFGQVVEGMEVVNEIKAVRTGNNGMHQDVPTDIITINEVVVVD